MNHSESTVTACPNCAHPASGPYCSQCGQKVHVETPTLWEFIHEYLHHYVALDGALTRTLGLLVARPGRLTNAFLAGRRQHYIKPLQLYITISFIFFVLLGLFGSRSDIRRAENPSVPQAQAGQSSTAAPVNAGAANDLALKFEVDDDSIFRSWAQRANRRSDEFAAHPDEVLRDTARKIVQRAPYGVFALMPIFAFLLWLLMRNRRMRYGAHVVFALHFHAFVFLLFLLMLLPLPLGTFAGVVAAAYLVVALRTVYGGRWVPQVLRAAVLLGTYMLCVGMMSALLILIALGA